MWRKMIGDDEDYLNGNESGMDAMIVWNIYRGN